MKPANKVSADFDLMGKIKRSILILLILNSILSIVLLIGVFFSLSRASTEKHGSLDESEVQKLALAYQQPRNLLELKNSIHHTIYIEDSLITLNERAARLVTLLFFYSLAITLLTFWIWTSIIQQARRE